MAREVQPGGNTTTNQMHRMTPAASSPALDSAASVAASTHASPAKPAINTKQAADDAAVAASISSPPNHRAQ
eukprot:scaffold565741_cov41-Prasinocladus_malaysianus.AAC.1